MVSDITNSIKAKLYDFTYTPFMSSMIIAWIILNHKYLLIYFAEYNLDEKLELLDEHSFSYLMGTVCIPYAMNVLFPVAFGLFYVFAYPWASKIFYEYTLERTKALKVIKQKIEDETPITQEEARQIRQDITGLTIERDELREKALNIEKYYKEEYRKKVQELKVDNDAKHDDTENSGVDASDTVASKHFQTPLLISGDGLASKEDDKKKVLRFFYESNYKPRFEEGALDDIVSATQVNRPKAEKILDDLVTAKTLERGPDRNKLITITKKGNSELIDMFDREGQKHE